MAASTIQVEASKYAITSVTVFKSSKAEIVRRFHLDLKNGPNKVQIRGLSSSIDPRSVRVSGFGDARLFDVVCKISKGKPVAYTSASSEVTRTMLVQKESLEKEKVAKQQESNILLKYAQSLTGEHVTPAQMSQFLETYAAHNQQTVSLISEINEKIVVLERRIEVEKDKLSSKRGSNHGEVDVVLFSGGSVAVDLQLTYIVNNARWTPTYELHATTENGKPSDAASLHYRAQVTQETGEDWNGTSLTLSTVSSDAISKRMPNVHSLTITPRESRKMWHQPPVQIIQAPQGGIPMSVAQGPIVIRSSSRSSSRSRRHSMSSPRNAYLVQPTAIVELPSQSSSYPSIIRDISRSPSPVHIIKDEFETIEKVDLVTFTRSGTFISETPVAASFTVDGESTIPSDGIEHQVSVAVLPFDAKVSYITVPRIDPRVFLQCEVQNTSEYRLLPGPVSIILDHGYVSTTFINHVDVGDKLTCTLGDDPSVKVTYERTSKINKSDGGTFTEATKTVTYSTVVTIHNKHPFAVDDLIIRDVIPTCQDSRIKIILRKPEGLAESSDGAPVKIGTDGLSVQWDDVVDGKGGEKEGKFKWTRMAVQGGEKVSVNAVWDVKCASDLEWYMN